MRLGTVFSGIGAIEQALKRLSINHEIVFACDNGDVELNLLEGEELMEYRTLLKTRNKKQLKDQKDIERLQVLTQKEQNIVDKIREEVKHLTTIAEKKSYVELLYKTKSRQQNFVKTTYLCNYNIDHNNFHLDIRFFDGRDYQGKIDLMVGGSPCQSFSSVGAKGGLNDTRGTLFYDFARVISECQPRVFIYENVKGLLEHDNGKTWAVMRNVFENILNYKIAEPNVLNACDYGIPQMRRRVFVVGIREDIECSPFEYPKPMQLQYTMQDFLEDNCAYGNFTYDSTNGNLIVNKVPGKANPKFTLSPAVQKYVLAGGTKNFKTSSRTDLPIARTLMKLMTQHHRAGVDNYITVQQDPLILRQLSDREALRLMGFTDDFNIAVSSMQTLRQAGNSIVVDVMMGIVRQILKTGAIE